ncbi:hypothetical protein F511_39783 [Dorcoceras hygrometricum]|uniref:Uncharacterized protein n=1 Tax=Dorcoceras hygrometricum TaxID=472368 RepID=A0A2Z7APS1_9LAMI|nr:hypothetical protein F511_39783 [Dorcoceras hygrometricum]
MQVRFDLSAVEFTAFLQATSFGDLTPPPKPHIGSFSQPWVAAHPRFRDESKESIFDIIFTACVHHRFLVVDCVGGRPFVAAKANVGWSFEFYNPALFARKFGLSQVIPHSVLYYPLDISHLGSEIEDGRFSKASVDLLSATPSLFLNPIRVCASEDENSFPAWWTSRCTVLAPNFSYPSAKDKKAAASVKKSVTPSTADVRSKKRKVSSTPPRSIQSSRGKKYPTRNEDNSEGDNTPRGSPTTEEFIDDYFPQGQDFGLTPQPDPPRIPLDFSSRRAQLQELEGSSPDADLSFADVEASTSSQLAKSFPSAESLSYARTAVHNFLELGLHQLGESQRLAMISAVSILKASPEFSAEHPLLDRIATIFSDSDAAQTKLTSLMAKRDDFHNKHRREEAMEQENLSVRDRIQNLTAEYDVSEDVVRRLEREILEHQSKMALILDEAEALKKTFLSNRSATKAAVDELASLKGDYADWTKEIQDSENFYMSGSRANFQTTSHTLSLHAVKQ